MTALAQHRPAQAGDRRRVRLATEGDMLHTAHSSSMRDTCASVQVGGFPLCNASSLKTPVPEMLPVNFAWHRQMGLTNHCGRARNDAGARYNTTPVCWPGAYRYYRGADTTVLVLLCFGRSPKKANKTAISVPMPGLRHASNTQKKSDHHGDPESDLVSG